MASNTSWARKIISKLYSKPYLLITNTVTGIVSISIGDVIQQNLENVWSQDAECNSINTNKQNYTFVWDPKRTQHMTYAGAYFSVFGHYWYSFLDLRFPPKSSGAVRKKLLAEMAMGPVLVGSVFYIVGTSRGHSLEQCWQYLKANFAIICGVEWLIYIPLQWVNFSYVPAQFRYLYVAIISLGYDAFLSYILHRNERYKRKLQNRIQDTGESEKGPLPPPGS